jgi:hypothetical protein
VKRQPDLEKIRDSVARVGRLSDALVRLGPFSIGLDGVLSWIPGVGELYSMAAAAFILVQAVRAGVPVHVIATCAALMALRTTVSAIPLAGPAAADLFLAHKWSARLVVRAIEAKLGKAASPIADSPPEVFA